MHSTTQALKQAEPVNAENLPVISANPLDLPAATFQEGLNRRKTNRAALMAWIRDALVDGSDYGKIHVVHKSKCQAGKDCKNPHISANPACLSQVPRKSAACWALRFVIRLCRTTKEPL